MTPTEIRVARIIASPDRALSLQDVGPDTAMAQDAHIDSIDVDDFVSDLQDEFGDVVRQIPWLLFSDQRASFRGCAVALVPFWLALRLVSRPAGERVLPHPDSSRYPRLTVRHIALVIDQGYWSEPAVDADGTNA